MLASMPLGYRPTSPDPVPPTIEEYEHEQEIIDDEDSPLSPLSPAAFEGDDPDDVEWDPSSEKAERRKSGFRWKYVRNV